MMLKSLHDSFKSLLTTTAKTATITVTINNNNINNWSTQRAQTRQDRNVN